MQICVMSYWLSSVFSPKRHSNTTMRKEQLKLRTEGNGSVAPLTSDDSDIENESTNKELTTASGDPFDNLLNPDDSTTAKKSNGVTKVPSPVPDDSDTEKNDTETEAENEADATELNESSAEKSATDENGDGDGDDGEGTEDDKEEEEQQYEVEAIVGTRSRLKQTQYFIKWKNFPEEQNTWEYEADVNCPELIAEYLEKNPKYVKKVRISLPASREAPKRSAAEKKSLAESEQESDDDSVKAKPSKKNSNAATSPNAKGRGRPRKDAPKSTKSASVKKEFEVAKIVDERMDGGKKYYRIRWKGYGAKDDTWELKKSLNCPEKIKEYETSKQEEDDTEYEVEKIMGEMIEKGKRLFYVKWKNFPESDNSWEAEESVDCADLIEKFRDSCRPATKATKRPATKAPVQTPKKAKKAAADTDDEQDPLAEDDEESDEELQWEVKQILDVRTRRGKKEYFIRWKNCDDSQNTWEPEDGINCPDLLAAFAKKKNK